MRVTRLLNAFKSDVMAGEYDRFAIGNDSMGSIHFYYMEEVPYIDFDGKTKYDYSKRSYYIQIYDDTQLYKLAVEYLIEANQPKQ